jgi:hypothetical protein
MATTGGVTTGVVGGGVVVGVGLAGTTGLAALPATVDSLAGAAAALVSAARG